MYYIDSEPDTNIFKPHIILKLLYNAQYQVDTTFFRILINSIYKFYISEYERVTLICNYSK